MLTLWLGLMKVGERGGAVNALARVVRPFFQQLFPEVPKDHPVHGSIIMNFAANMLGLDNAATPLGLKAMQELQELNPDKDTASNAQIMFLVLNTSGLTVIPISIMVYRAQMGAANPSDIFLPILLTTFFSTLAGLIAVALVQKINLLDRTILAYLVGLTGLVARDHLSYFSRLPQEQVETVSNVVANVILFGIIAAFISLAMIRRVNVYEAFIDGAKEGFAVVIKIIPYLVAILVAIGVFRASGAHGLPGGGDRAGLRPRGDEHGLHRGAAHGADEAAQRERRAGHDGGRHADLRGGLLRRPARLHLPGGDRHDLLHHRSLLRVRGGEEDPACRALRAVRRLRRHRRRRSSSRTCSSTSTASQDKAARKQKSPAFPRGSRAMQRCRDEA